MRRAAGLPAECAGVAALRERAVLACDQGCDGAAGGWVREAGAGCGAWTRLARERGTRALMLVQGGLVLSRGLGSVEPFRQALKALPEALLKE